MDKAKRLTRWAEWDSKETYEWFSRGSHYGFLKLIQINRSEGYVTLEDLEDPLPPFRCIRWRNRFRVRIQD